MDSLKNLLKALIIKLIVYGIALFYGWILVLSILYKWARHGKDFWVVKERPLTPKCLQDINLGRHSYIRIQENIKIHYVENGDRSKPLMLFVHGFPEFWFSWRKQLKHFAKTHWVVALDMRGYGDSDKPKELSAYKFDILQKDIYDFVKALKRDKCILVGHDWGGAISWGVASKYPDLVEKLIIMNAPHSGAFSKKIKGSFKQFIKSWYIFVFQLPFLPELVYRTNDLGVFSQMFGSSITEEELEGYKYTWAKKGAWTPPINYYRNTLQADGLLNPATFPIIMAPTLLIWGENDIALEKDLAEMCVEFVNDIRIEYIPNGSHFVQQDKPQEVNRAMETFLGI